MATSTSVGLKVSSLPPLLHSDLRNLIPRLDSFRAGRMVSLHGSLPGTAVPRISQDLVPASRHTAIAAAADSAVSRQKVGADSSRTRASNSRRRRTSLCTNASGRTATGPTTNGKAFPSLVAERDQANEMASSGRGLKVPKRNLSLKWTEISSDLVLGDGPQCSEDVHSIKAMGATAIVSLMIDDEHERLGIDWAVVDRTATSVEMVAVKISMDEHFYQDQATALPEAVRTVASLTANGGRVYLSDASGLQRASLVVLSYLTFAKAMDFRQAMKQIIDVCPSADPNMAAWEETKNKLLAGESQRLATFAQDLSRGRQHSGTPGSSAEDWLTAQRLLIAEHFKQGVSSHLQLTDKLSQISYWKARKDTMKELDRIKMLAAEKTREALIAKEDTAVAQQQVSLLSRRIKELLSDAKGADVTLTNLVEDNDKLSQEVSIFLEERLAAEESLKETIGIFKKKLEEAEARESAAVQRAQAVEREIDHLSETVKQLHVRESKAVGLADIMSNASVKLPDQLPRDGNRESEISAAEEAKTRISEVLKELGTEDSGKYLSGEAAPVSQPLLTLRTTVGDLVKQVLAQKDFISVSEAARGQAQEEVGRLTKELNSTKTSSSKPVATSSLIPELEKQLVGLRSELVSAVEKIGGLEEEKHTYTETLTNLRNEANKAKEEHILELAEMSEQHMERLEKTALYYQTEVAGVAAELSAATLKGKGLVEELQGARDYIRHLAEELERLQTISEGEAEMREQQVLEELKFLKGAQRHVDVMTSQKMSLERQKVVLQKALLVSIGLAILGPVVAWALLGHSPDVSKVVNTEAPLEQSGSVLSIEDSSDKLEGERMESGGDRIWKILGKQSKTDSDMVKKVDRELAALNTDLLKLKEYMSSP